MSAGSDESHTFNCVQPLSDNMTGEVDNTIFSLIYIIIPDNIKGPAHTYPSGKQCSLLFLLLLLLYLQQKQSQKHWILLFRKMHVESVFLQTSYMSFYLCKQACYKFSI